MKIVWMAVALLFMAGSVSAQQKAPVKKAAPKKGTKNAKKKKTSEGGEFTELICYEDGPCTFDIQKGDTLVYEVNTAGRRYDLMIVPNKFSESNLADFNWLTTGDDAKAGHVVIFAQALKSSKRYVSYLPAGELKLSDASFMWLCSDNFTEKQTTIAFDGNEPETFSSPEANAASASINYKGKPIELDGFIMQNKAEGQPDRKELWVQNITSNLLIFKLDLGKTTFMLKEVREKKVVAKPAAKPAVKKP